MKTADPLQLDGEPMKLKALNERTSRTADPARDLDRVPAWKRALDITCLCIAAPTVLPLMLLISAFIKIVSPGPVFFRQERIGYKGKAFMCLKFRTMKVNADTKVHQNHLKDLIKSDAPMVKMDAKGDPRLITLGHILRSSGLDELPQLINVLKGEMSLVGPRPCTRYEYDQFEPWHKQRFDALPGLTGLWQVSGKNKTTFSEMISLDIFYAQRASAWMDAKIMFRTFPVLFNQLQESRTRKTGVTGEK